jgi:hypothetical protein
MCAPSPAAFGWPTGRPVSAIGTAASCGSRSCRCTTSRIRATTSGRVSRRPANGPSSTIAPLPSVANGRGTSVPPHAASALAFAAVYAWYCVFGNWGSAAVP